MGGNFRDRSPLGRPGRMDDTPMQNWEFNKSGPGGPGGRSGPGGPGGRGGPGGPGGRGNFGGFGGDRKSRFDDFKGTGGPMRDMGPGPGAVPGFG